MDIKEELLKEHSKAQTKKISEYIGDHSDRFAELVLLFLHDEWLVTQRAAWVMSHCAENYPSLIQPHLMDMVEHLKSKKLHDAVIRNSVKIFSQIELPENVQGHLLQICFDYLLSTKIPVAIQVHSMQIIYNISQDEPDLLNELKMVIEERLPYGTAGFKSRGKKILAGIHKKQSA